MENNQTLLGVTARILGKFDKFFSPGVLNL